jgi:hypothetical protein
METKSERNSPLQVLLAPFSVQQIRRAINHSYRKPVMDQLPAAR